MSGSSIAKKVLIGVLLFVLFIIVAPQANSLLHLTTGRLHAKAQGARDDLSALWRFADIASPPVANFVANLTLGIGIVLALLFINLLVFTPWSLLALHRKVGMLENQVVALRQEIQNGRQPREASVAPVPLRPLQDMWPAPFQRESDTSAGAPARPED